MKKTFTVAVRMTKKAQSTKQPDIGKLKSFVDSASKRAAGNASAASDILAKMKAAAPIKKIAFMAKIAEMAMSPGGISMAHGAKRLAQQAMALKNRVARKTPHLSNLPGVERFRAFAMENPGVVERSRKLHKTIAGTSGLAAAKVKAMSTKVSFTLTEAIGAGALVGGAGGAYRAHRKGKSKAEGAATGAAIGGAALPAAVIGAHVLHNMMKKKAATGAWQRKATAKRFASTSGLKTAGFQFALTKLAISAGLAGRVAGLRTVAKSVPGGSQTITGHAISGRSQFRGLLHKAESRMRHGGTFKGAPVQGQRAAFEAGANKAMGR